MPDQLEQLRALARLDQPVSGGVSPELRAQLGRLTPEQLEAVERVAAMAYFAKPHALRPAEQLSDAEAVQEWHRLTRRPPGGLA